MAVVAYHPFSEAVYDDPYPIYRRLRDDAPAFYLKEFDCWFLSRFDDVWSVMGDASRLASDRGTTSTHLLTHQTPTAPNISMLDGDEHMRTRSYLSPFFLPAKLRTLEPRVREIAREAVDAVAARGSCDAVTDLGGAVSVRVACTLLGLPLEDAAQIMEWVNLFFDREPGRRGSTERGIEGVKQLALYLLDVVRAARKRGASGDSVLSKMLTAPLGGRALDDIAILQHLNMLVIGGSETFPKVLSAAVDRLAAHPEQRAECAADPGLLRHAFQETLRIDMPTQMLGRTVTADIELHGEKLRPGQGVMFLFGAANRDEREFDTPDRFDVHRKAPRILSFGHGQHMCLGAHVARLEGRVLLEEWLRRVPEWDVVEDDVVRLRSEFFRGFASLPIRYRPA